MSAPRHDLYRAIHKALRAAMFDTARRLGALDADDPGQLAGTLDQAERVLGLLGSHLRHENDHLHTAIEARRPGAARHTADEHREHVDSLAALAEDVQALRQAGPDDRAALAQRLYQHLSLFIADSLAHMQWEETHDNATLWALYGDAELVALQGRLAASVTPHEQAEALGWMARALTPIELAGLLGGLRAQATPEAFGAALSAVRPHLEDTRWARLTHSLGLPA